MNGNFSAFNESEHAEPPVHSCQPRIASQSVNSVRIDPVTKTMFLNTIVDFLKCGRSHVVHFLPADPTVIARSNPSYREILNQGHLNVADGMSVIWALRKRGVETDRLAGSDALSALCDFGLNSSLRHYFFGGTTSTLGQLQANLKARFADLRIVGSESPPFRQLADDEFLGFAARVRSSGADLLWVGLGTPKQDYAAKLLCELNAAPVILCVGAAFDFQGGSKKRAPEWMQNAGFEWVHRLLSEPRRLWRRYLIGNAKFLLGLMKDREEQ